MNYNNYRELGFTTLPNGLIAYYSQLQISDAQLILIIQLEAFSQRGEFFPSNEKLAANTNLSVRDVGTLIQRLIDQNLLTLEQVTDTSGKIGNRYNLRPLYNKLDEYLDQHILIKHKPNITEITDNLNNSTINQLTRRFEIEFGRYLSPIEKQELASWINIDHYSPKMIELALREAVLSQVYSLKYIDRILLNWQNHNLKTEEDIENFLRRGR